MQNAAITVPDLDIGPCKVLFDGVDLGATLDNVVISMKYDKAPMKADQTGTLVLDDAVSGMEITVKTSIAETRRKALWAAMFPSADLAGVAPNDHLTFADKVALRSLSRAKVLILKPMVENAVTLDLDHYFYKALPTEESVLTKGPGEQDKLPIVWRIYPDTSVLPFRLYRFGDNTL